MFHIKNRAVLYLLHILYRRFEKHGQEQGSGFHTNQNSRHH